MLKYNPLVLLILDGWGMREDNAHNAIKTAHTPNWDNWWRTYPHLLLEASGTAVGLPPDQMGNSEVGHMHIGAGRLILQDYTRINEAIKQGRFAKNPVFIQSIEDLKKQKKALHIMGLLSPGGVHSHEDHLFAFLHFCHEQQFEKVYLHLFLDGRDTPPQSAILSIKRLQIILEAFPVATIASLTGRYYAMDRDNRWSRIEPVYRLLTTRETPYQFNHAIEAIEYFYQKGITDEFIPPTAIQNAPIIEDNDAIFFFNFRSDRARQLTRAFIDETFNEFDRPLRPSLSHFISMTLYAKTLKTQTAFPPQLLHNTFGEVLARKGLRQLRIAETEKYAHVTFFFNGGSEKIFPQEERILIPSPPVTTYDKQPEMSAPLLTDTIVKAILNQQVDVIIANFANADMVGHTGNFAATVKAIECLDTCMGKINQAVQHVNGKLLITADHGNAEFMYNEALQQPHTAHTNDPVPLLYLGNDWVFNSTAGSLIDIAPTVLTLLNIDVPTEMTGHVLMDNAS